MNSWLLNILTLGIRPLYTKQFSFHKMISAFRNEIEQTEKPIKNTDLQRFYDKLDTFNLRFVFFSRHYKKYITNLNHIKPELEDEHPDISLLRVAVSKNKWKPTKPFDIFVHNIKYNYKLTSKPFIAYEKKHNKKKLNAPGNRIKKPEDPNKSNQWIRVPIGRHHCAQESGSCGCSQN